MEDGRSAAFPGVYLSVLDLDSVGGLAAAIADCWRSVFSPVAIRYVLRMAAEPLDLSMAVLVQAQVEASWYGVYASVDPVTGAGGPVADLSDAGPDALVNGAHATIEARRHADGWTGPGVYPGVAVSLEAVRLAALRLSDHLRTEVDVEFAVPSDGREPVILQCRPLTGVFRGPAIDGAGAAGGRGVLGRGCAPGRAVGLATALDGPTADDQPRVAVVEQLTSADYGLVFRHVGIVMELDASPLSHVAILCRELGVPLVCGIDGARAALAGRRVAVNGTSGNVDVFDDACEAPPEAPSPPAPPPTMSAVELLLRVLAEGRPGHVSADEADRIARRSANALGADSTCLTSSQLSAEDLEQLERLGADLLGPDFSAASFLDDLTARLPNPNG